MAGSETGHDGLRAYPNYLRSGILATIAQMCDWLEMAGPDIEMVPYRTQWRSHYAVLAALLRGALGDAVAWQVPDEAR